MGLIRKWNTVQNLSTGEKQAITKQQVARMISELFDHMKIVYEQGRRHVYDNPLGLNPKQVMEGFGADGLELARLKTLLKDCLNLAVPGTVPDDGHPYS